MHPAWCDDGKTFAVGNVVVCRKGMLHGVHRPAALAVAQTVYTVASEGCGIENLGACVVVLRVCQHNLYVLHERLHGSLHEGIVHVDMVGAEIRLHDMVYAVGNAGERLLYWQREGVCRVDEAHGREYEFGEVSQFVVCLCA